ncbi:AAA family ATPase, partial [bacterium]|nr:AAA family ATPase [bacterium]
MITTLLTGKGGAGRTTIAFNLAVASAAAGVPTLLIDTDQNASIHQAFERRQLVASQFELKQLDVRYSV